MPLLALAILGIYLVGDIIKGVGDVQKINAQAEADKLKADQLDELSKPGGYYDQVLASLKIDLANIESDRSAAGKMMAITATQTQEAATMQEMGVARQGAKAVGSVGARAGAGNLGQGGSVEVQKEAIQTEASQNIAYTQRTADRQIEQARLQYEEQLRGLAARQAQNTAATTLEEFKKTSGTEDATLLKNEADWLSTWGVGLAIAGDVLNFGAQALGVKGLDFSGNSVSPTTPFDTSGPSMSSKYPGLYGTPSTGASAAYTPLPSIESGVTGTFNVLRQY
jgi:hypothetical protein